MFVSHLSARAYVTWDITPDLTCKTGWAQAFKAPDLRHLIQTGFKHPAAEVAVQLAVHAKWSISGPGARNQQHL